MTKEELKQACEKARTSVTPQQWAAWETALNGYKKSQPTAILISEDIFYSGFWLLESLKSSSCNEEIIEKICSALGQRQAMLSETEDAWGPAVEAFDRFVSKHEWEEPGQELGDKLLQEKFGNPLNREKLLEWLKSTQIGRSCLASAIDEFMIMGKLAKPDFPGKKNTNA